MNIRDRIVDLRRVPASELLPNPRNWRTHPRSQQDALRGVLAEIGFADALIARETDDGLQLIDGHLRADVMGQETVPVLVVDLTTEEADKLLVTLDPLAAMANTAQDQLLGLLAETRFEAEAVNAMLEALANGERQPMPELYEPSDDQSNEIPESYNVLVVCSTEAAQLDLLTRLETEGYECRALIS